MLEILKLCQASLQAMSYVPFTGLGAQMMFFGSLLKSSSRGDLLLVGEGFF